jgi:hypothetical protein
MAGYTYYWDLGDYGCVNSMGYATYGMGTSVCAMTSGLFSCRAVPTAGGFPMFSNPIQVRVLPGSAGSLLMPRPINTGGACAGTASLCISYAFHSGFPTVFAWYKDNAVVPGANGANYIPAAAGYYKYSIGNGCVTAFSDSLYVPAAPPAAITPAGPTALCAGGSVVLQANTGPGLGYQWKRDGNVIAGASASSYTAYLAGAYTVMVGNACGSAVSAPVSVSVTPLPVAVVSAAGPTSFCQGGSVLLQANTGAGLSWQWKLDGGSLPGATGPDFTASVTGSYSVDVSNACGTAVSVPVDVTVHPLPSAVITPAGPVTFCTGGSVVLNANTGPGLSYQWKRNGTNLAGATGSSYTATVSGNYKVVVSTAACGSVVSAPVTVTRYTSPPAKPGAISGPSSFCSNQAGVVYSVAPVANATTYQWLAPTGAVIVSGQGTPAITVNFGTKSGSIKVRAGNACGYSNYQSKKVSKSCRETADPLPAAGGFAAYPNPFSGEVTVRTGLQPGVAARLTVSDPTGRIVYAATVRAASATLPLGPLPPGVYLLRLEGGGQEKTARIIRVQSR